MTHAQLCRLGIGIPVDPVLPLVEDVLGYVRDDALAAVLAARVAFHLHTVPVPTYMLQLSASAALMNQLHLRCTVATCNHCKHASEARLLYEVNLSNQGPSVHLHYVELSVKKKDFFQINLLVQEVQEVRYRYQRRTSSFN